MKQPSSIPICFINVNNKANTFPPLINSHFTNGCRKQERRILVAAPDEPGCLISLP